MGLYEVLLVEIVREQQSFPPNYLVATAKHPRACWQYPSSAAFVLQLLVLLFNLWLLDDPVFLAETLPIIAAE
jgi:hypothetical protein